MNFLQFSNSKKIVSAETIWGNTVYSLTELGNTLKIPIQKDGKNLYSSYQNSVNVVDEYLSIDKKKTESDSLLWAIFVLLAPFTKATTT